MKKLDSKGFGVIEGILILVIAGMIGGAGYYVYRANKSTNESLNNTGNSEAVKQDKEAEAEDPNEGYLVVEEWGLRFKIPSGLNDIKYFIHDDTVAFYAKPTDYDVEYRSDYEKLLDGYPQYSLGTLSRSSESAKDSMNFKVDGKKIGNYYYYTSHSFSSLATGAGPSGLYFDSSCDKNSNTPRCNNLLEAEGEAFELVNGHMNEGNDGLLETIELAQ